MRRRSLITRVNSHGVAYIILYTVRTRFVIIFDDEVYYNTVYLGIHRRRVVSGILTSLGRDKYLSARAQYYYYIISVCGARVIRDRWLVDVRCRNAAAGCVTYWPRADIVIPRRSPIVTRRRGVTGWRTGCRWVAVGRVVGRNASAGRPRGGAAMAPPQRGFRGKRRARLMIVVRPSGRPTDAFT